MNPLNWIRNAAETYNSLHVIKMSTITDRVDALFSKWDKTDSPGCVVALIQDGEFVYTRGYGMADLERNVPLTPQSMFDIGSVGKQFTATVIAILANQGHVSLDSSIRKYLPEMQPYADDISIRHLIHHTSGLREYLTLLDLQGLPDENIYAEEALLELIVRQKGLNFKPGKEFLYSNTGYFLLGVIAQRVTGRHITQLIQEHILDPLGMRHTTFNKDYRPIVKNRALSYNTGETDGAFINVVALAGGYGDGAVVINVEELLLWDRNFYNNKLNNAQPDLIEQLHDTGKLNNGKSTTYAFGLVMGKYKGQNFVSHSGSWAGYCTEMMRFPNQRFTVICISNLGNVDPTILCRQITDIYLENTIKPSKEQKEKNITVDDMKEYTGIYQGKYLTANVFFKNNVLYFLSGTYQHKLKWLGRKKFQMDGSLDTVSFSGRLNESLTFEEYGAQGVKLKRIKIKQQTSPSKSFFTGEYFNSELNTRYTITIKDNELYLKCTPIGTFKPLTILIENTLICDLGEMRFNIKNGSVKGFTLNANGVVNLKFRKKK